MYRNLINDEKVGSKKLLKLKYRSGDVIIQTFCKIASPQKLDPHSLIGRNWTTDLNLMNHEEVGSRKLLKLKYRRATK